MASVVKLALGTLKTGLHQAALNLSSKSLHRLHIPRPASSTTTLSPGHGIATTTTTSLHQPLLRMNCSSPLSSFSASSSSLLPRLPLLQSVNRLAPCMTGLQSCRSYHVRVALKKRCSSCYFVRRKGRLFVECKAKPRHKQMQVMSKRKTWKEDYSEGFVRRAVHWKYNRDHGYYKLGNTPFVRHDWLKGKIGVTV
ncbi:uncharacterized protein LOC143300190 [Babylonia areolata]|uniref:uncharacterized protein LOC143300190 n=1 Tax=Babylonia areolata TaxID=304850 RepID=UPI003FD1086F